MFSHDCKKGAEAMACPTTIESPMREQLKGYAERDSFKRQGAEMGGGGGLIGERTGFRFQCCLKDKDGANGA